MFVVWNNYDFSWFNRPGSISGDSLTYSGSYNVSNGKDITAVTYAASNPDGSEYSANPFDFKSLQTVSAHETRYFCTEVKNTGAAPQSISLFLSNSETNELSVGVNSPSEPTRDLPPIHKHPVFPGHRVM